MANQDVKVSALQSASTLSTNDLSLETVVDELSETGYTSKKITEGAKASQYLESFTFSNLTTEAKTIVGAINEAATTGGNNIFYIHWTTPSTITETGADIAAAYADGSDFVILLTDSQTGQVYTLPLVKVDDNAGALNLSFGATVYKKTQVVALLQLLKPSYTIQGMDYEKVSTVAIDDTTTTSTTETWSANKINSELADKAEIADTVVSTASAWSSSRIVSLLPTESASGAVASFETPLTLPLVSHNVTIEPVQAGTGDPSPSNVRPISGWSAVNVTRTGTNLNDGLTEEGIIDTTNGTDKTQSGYLRSKNYLHIKGGVNYYGKADGNPSTFVMCFYDKNLNYIGYLATSVVRNAVFTAPSEAHFFRYYHSSGDYRISINYPSTTTTYEPYTSEAEEVEISLGQTVYGGELDVTNGVLRVTRSIVEFDGSNDEPWVISSGGTFFYLDGVAYKHDEVQSAVMCSIFQPLPNGNSSSFTGDNQCLFLLSTANDRLYVKHDESTSVSDFRTFLSNNPMGLLYILATPVEITLTPEQINTLKGVNNIWADTGDTAVEHKQDIQTYIDKKIAEAVGGNRSLSLSKAPEEVKEEESEEGGNDER